MAIVFNTDGTKVHLPKNATFKDYKTAICGYFEVVENLRAFESYVLANEDGLLLELEQNPFHPSFVGNVIICTHDEFEALA